MTVWLMANPKAGGKGRGREFWKHHLEAVGISRVQDCDLENLAWMKQVGPDELVLAAGGDGSVNQAAALCVETGATLAVLPSGTANDFARNLGLPLDDPGQICELVAQQHKQQVDVASVGKQIFLNVAHIGVGTWAVRESPGGLKQIMGRFSYAVSLLKAIVTRRGFRAVIESETGAEEGRWLSIAVATGAFFGGGNEIPNAAANDGQLNIIAVRPQHALRLLITFLGIKLKRTSSLKSSNVLHTKSAWCNVRTQHPQTITADGELIGETPLSVTCRKGSLTVIGPYIRPT